jgi:hypothetical protein
MKHPERVEDYLGHIAEAIVGRHRHQHWRTAVLRGPTDVERNLIRIRTTEGRERAKARGQYRGRPPKVTPQRR